MTYQASPLSSVPHGDYRSLPDNSGYVLVPHPLGQLYLGALSCILWQRESALGLGPPI